jgi:hypothetical protein
MNGALHSFVPSTIILETVRQNGIRGDGKTLRS